MRLLLDANISPSVAAQLLTGGIDAIALRDWHDGSYRTAADDQVLVDAAVEGRVLVTYDLKTVPLLLKEWPETRPHHGGVVLIDEKTLRPIDVGGILKALQTLVREHADEEWRDRAVFLRAK
ncbi:MAG: hypothetical protein EXR50_02430 [Dehalococcoidia bacterium]|nr:hypothetical protein [Dehalococcoidia bacterium]